MKKCMHCAREIFEDENGDWKDEHPQNPYFCPHALVMRHRPTEEG